jgi:hypothetical protein
MGIERGTSGWLRIRATSSVTLFSVCEIVSQSLYLASSPPGADVVEARRIERGGLEARREQPAHDVIREELHAAVRVVDDEPLARAEQLVGGGRPCTSGSRTAGRAAA